jgi:outer membrane protein assembly factor BamB
VPFRKAVGQPIVTAGGGLRKPTVVVGGDAVLVALDLESGRLRWKGKSAGRPTDGTQPIAAGDVLLRGSQVMEARADGELPEPQLRRYVPATGKIVWTKNLPIDNELQRQVVADGNWYLQDAFGLYVYDARTGAERWTREVDCANCGPAAGGGRVYVAGGELAALDARTGRTIWSVPTEGSAGFGSWPAQANGIVYLRTVTSRSLGGDRSEFSFWLEAHRATDGKRLWRAAVGKKNGFWLSPIAVGSGIVVYPSEDGRLHALDALTGARRWTMPGNDRDVRPAVANGLVWTGDSGGRLVALDARTGRRRWASRPFLPHGPVSPVLAAGYVLTGDQKTHQLVAYRVGP